MRPVYDAIWRDVPMPLDYTCECGLSVHPSKRSPEAIHIAGCNYEQAQWVNPAHPKYGTKLSAKAHGLEPDPPVELAMEPCECVFCRAHDSRPSRGFLMHSF